MSRRRGHGEGSIYQRADGRWVGAVSLPREHGKRPRKVVNGKTQAEARTKLRKAQQQVDAGLPVTDEKLTVASIMESWLSTLDGHVSTNTLDNYATIARLHILPTLGPGS